MSGRSLAAWLRRACLEPLDLWRAGSTRLSYARTLEQTQWLPHSELLARQWSKLTAHLQQVAAHNSFHRRRFEAAGLDLSQPLTPDGFSRLPLLTKADIRGAGKDVLSQGYEASSLMLFKTGGSTGKPLEIWMTEELSERRNALARRHDIWTGWQPGEPIGALWGNPVAPDWKARLRRLLVQPLLVLDTMNVSEASALEFARAWRRLRPTLLFGHAHSLFLLARLADRWQDNPIQPRAVLSTSMMLMAHERTVIERVFRAPVFDRYGCEEVSLIGSECERHNGMHLNIEHLYIEFLDDSNRPVAPGTSGNIVVTDLENLAMPLIRYRVEDQGEPSQRHCPCGRGLPLMERVTGRVADFLVRSDGSKVAGISLIENTLTRIHGIEQLQIVQADRRTLALRVVKGAGFGDSATEELVSYFQKLMGPQVTVTLEPVASISPEPNGKYRFCISHVTD